MKIAVTGAFGHTGRFILTELLERGHDPIAIVRDESRCVSSRDHRVETRVAALDDADALDRALSGARAVINAAGPFLDTATAVVEAALRAGIHYADLTAEQASARSTLAHGEDARRRDVVLLPAAAFYGGLGDLLVTATMGDRTYADRIDIAVALDRWWPTIGTRKTSTRNNAPRVIFEGGAFAQLPSSRPSSWHFPAPFAMRTVLEVPFTETILIPTHLAVHELHHHINDDALRDVRDPTTAAPVAADERGRSAQTFAMDVVVRRGDTERRGRLSGRDIYAVTAPIVVEAIERACASDRARAGAFALGELFDARSFLRSLERRGDIALDAEHVPA